MAISGNTAVIGAGGSITSADSTAYVYQKGAAGWPAKPTVRLKEPGQTTTDAFGFTVAVSGKTALVLGAEYPQKIYAVYAYTEGSSGWSATPAKTLPDPKGKAGTFQFGTAMAMSGSTALIGDWGANSYPGLAYLYVGGTSGLPTAPTVTLKDPGANVSDLFGEAVTLAGNAAVIGAEGTGSAPGHAYIYTKGTSGWPVKPTAALTDPAKKGFDAFGSAVAVSGTVALISAYNTLKPPGGVAYIYTG